MKKYSLPIQEIRKFSESIQTLKNNFRSTRNLTNNPHFYGKVGEFIFKQEFGLDPDMSINIQGDSQDFIYKGKKIDIKTTTYWKDPFLREFSNPRKVPDIYVLVAVQTINENNGDVFGEIVGWCYSEELLSTPLKNLGNIGKRYILNRNELRNIKDL